MSSTTKTDKFSVLYKINATLATKGSEGSIINVSSSDIVSIAMVHNYDTASFPIIRLRLYSDLSVMEKLTQYPDQIFVNVQMFGNVYKMSDDDKSPSLVCGANNLTFTLKGYIENKNIPTSTMDQYDQGLKKKSDLNVTRKVPIDIYCYDSDLIHYMRKKAPSIFKNTSLTTVIESMFRKQGIVNYSLEPMTNQNKFDQVVIPNLNINETISFFDNRYGMYSKGGQMYGDIDKLYICNSDVNNGNTPYPIHVESYKNSSDMGGLRRINKSLYQMNTKAENVSVISETDIEKVLNSEHMVAVNVNTLEVDTVTMTKLYSDERYEEIKRVANVDSVNKVIDMIHDKIATPDLLHKSLNPYVAQTYNARITERITRVDVSGVGFDIGKMKIDSRYNLIFDSPIRGMSINQLYRPTTMTHVITNLDSDLFVAQTTMSLCSN